MKTAVTFEYILPGPKSEISLYFSNFHLFGKHHPYMTEVIESKNTSTKKHRYHVRESLKLWDIIKMKPEYEVEVEIIEPEKQIRYQSEVSKGVFLDIDYIFIDDLNTNTVKVVEAMVLQGYPILNSIFISLLKKSRKLLIESIRKELSKKNAI